MPSGWNIHVEEHSTSKDNNQTGLGPTSGAGSQGHQMGTNSLVGHNGPIVGTPMVPNQKGDPKEDEKWLRVIEGIDKYGLDAIDLCLVPDVVLPTNFKTPEFDKYKGSSCLRMHLAMYCQKMVAYVQEDKILVHYFQDSLSRASLNRYVNLERGHIRTWKDLAEAFLKQYRYNEEMALDRSRLQNMNKRDQEGFKEYTQK
ncbi:hypothetical protein CR513_14255, partial [Mucuna pruriens]